MPWPASRRWSATPTSTGWAGAHGQDGTAPRLLPISVDGLILVASLVLLHEACDTGMRTGWPGSCYGLGIGATIGANVTFGAGYATTSVPAVPGDLEQAVCAASAAAG